MDDDGFVRNTFLLRVTNNDAVEQHAFAVGVEGLEDVQVSVPPLILGPGEGGTVPLIVRVPAEGAQNTQDVKITVRTNGEQRSVRTTFKGPNG